MISVTRRYRFAAAHFLPLVRDGHKCKRMHGHNYEFEVTLQSEVVDNGMLIDFWDLDAAVQPIIDQIDHRTLNDIEGLENPTAENIAGWLLVRIDEIMGPYESPPVKQVQVWEEKDCSATASYL
jgi:6-pyruvoyltetrahydropterin/6-carboxytetrahydropterin synthase